ncbi:DNA-protecting protein DprA [Candidatus Saccharibacteria bacterium]|nr:DNA-protecting protein DprA [Candidatus Saccharibacteria bacterium]
MFEIQKLTKGTQNYPVKLTHLAKPPDQLSTLGVSLSRQLKNPVLAVVGSRKASSYGRGVTEDLTSSAARAGICIVSGLALGIDSIAHNASLAASGKTIAVLPSGLGNIYPASHRALAKRILQNNGTLISEYPDDFMPRRESFIQRNRIIAGLSDALLVTEAAERSGSLYTARFALEIGKPVLAVPGNINSPTSAGTNNLIKSGAIAVTSEQDIFNALDIKQKDKNEEKVFGDNENETTLIKLLAGGVANGHELLEQSSLAVETFQQTLTILEIKGVVTPLGNNNWKLR